MMDTRNPQINVEPVHGGNLLTSSTPLTSWNRQPALPFSTPLKENWISSGAPRFFRDNTSRNLTMFSRKTSSSSSPGRHIPRRQSLDVDRASFKLQKNTTVSSDEEDDVFESNKLVNKLPAVGTSRQIRRRMACLSEGASEQTIFSFTIDRKHGASRDKRLRSTDKDVLQPDMTYRKSARSFPKHSERILDLPNFEDNFFTHTMAWCSDDKIIAGLENCVFVCYVDGRGANLLSELSDNVSYSSVACKGMFMVCGTNRGGIELWDLETSKNVEKNRHPHKGREAVVWPVSECRLGCLDWAPDSNNIFVSGCRNGQIDTWDKRLGLKVPVHTKSFAHTRGTICNIKYNNRGRYLASGDSGNMLKVWDMNNFDKPVLDKWAHTSAVRALAWHPEEPYLLVTGGGIDDGFIRVWNVLKDQPKIKERYIKAQVCCLVWSPLTNELISSQALRGRNYTQNNQIFIWEYPEMRKIGNLLGHSGRVLHMDFSPSKTMLASAGGDETLRIWKMAKEKSKSKQWPTSSLKHTGFGCIR